MKKSACFINISRGELVGETAFLDTLESGVIRGAALDVFNIEPLPKDSRWRSQKWGTEGKSQLLLSPHMGHVEEGIVGRLYVEQAEITRRWHEGEELMNIMA